MKRATCMLVMMLALASLSSAQDVRKPSSTPTPTQPQGNPLTPGPQGAPITSQVYVGEPAPDFELDGSQGQPVRLAHLKGYWVLLVFSDGRAGLAPLKDIEGDLRRLGVKPYGICADMPHVLKTFVERQQLPFVLLSDFSREISQLYGLNDQTGSKIRPGLVLIDRRGVVRFALLGQTIPLPEMLELVRTSVAGV
jgi:peroxiredoxin